MKYNVIDLFAGAGGLSNGFIQTEKYDIKVAVEINKYAKKTYQENHKDVEVYADIKHVNFKKIKEQYKEKGEKIDVVIGGPPCQGFSNANRQKNTLINGNNELVKEYIRAIEHLEPKAFVLENVRTMQSDKHKFFCEKNVEEELEALSVKIIDEEFVIGKNYFDWSEFYSFLESDEIIDEYVINKTFKVKLNSLYKKKNNEERYKQYLLKHRKVFDVDLENWMGYHKKYWNEKYKDCFKDIYFDFQILYNNEKSITTKHTSTCERLFNKIQSILETQKVISKIKEIQDYNVHYNEIKIKPNNHIVVNLKTYNVFEYIMAKLRAVGYNVKSAIINAADFGIPQVRRRLFIIGIHQNIINSSDFEMPNEIENRYFTIENAIKDLEDIEPYINIKDDIGIHKRLFPLSSELSVYLNDNVEILYNHVMTDTRKTAKERFKNLKPGQNFHDLNDYLKDTYADPNRTQSSIYRRLEYDKPSPTVTNVRKSMWIHPSRDRALSIREAARLQSFQDSFVFKGTKDSQYQQIGNAVPPLLAKAIAKKILVILNADGADSKELIV